MILSLSRLSSAPNLVGSRVESLECGRIVFLNHSPIFFHKHGHGGGKSMMILERTIDSRHVPVEYQHLGLLKSIFGLIVLRKVRKGVAGEERRNTLTKCKK